EPPHGSVQAIEQRRVVPIVAMKVDVVIVVELIAGVQRQSPIHANPGVVDHSNQIGITNDDQINGDVHRNDERGQDEEELKDQELDGVRRRGGEDDRRDIAVVPAVQMAKQQSVVQQSMAVIETGVDGEIDQ